MSRLLFRADGNAQIGLGHVMRCLALANMLRDDFSMRFAIAEPTYTIENQIEATGLAVLSLPASGSQLAFINQIATDEIVVLDGYTFDEAFQRSVRSKARKLVFIDDLVTGHQVADVVINHAGGVSADEYDAEPYTQFCLGPHYAMLRPEFLRPEGFAKPSIDGPIFVSLGGADPENRSLEVLQGIQKVDRHLPVQIVLGPFHPNRPAIEAFQSQLPNLTVLQNRSASQMVDTLQACSLAITASSTISYEVCAINRPLITVVTADNQIRLARFQSEEKLALSVLFTTYLTNQIPVLGLDEQIRLAIQSIQPTSEIVSDSLLAQRHFFDGQSPSRFRALFRNLSA
ncbi:UDP-2,4-diacetamido-2,4,6-trideoxy-beta-L-altropyranose hydrolase [Spirosoma aerolatum]|uniref:UDP-2,4-diacetamido-2,4, 6-trideoxy-beta-L-altropyranose hydrolase n=1 Tax=Spirosoma aerolatum TaxID=1211326 RepID=UPI0009AD2590|nr:UDP-2,4-diacetamido-2,4,6-trideoxy-beta-L-altropyranose hydrolase [Spirosoma aerolatum]